MKLGVSLVTQHTLKAIGPGAVTLASSITGAPLEVPCQAVVLLTERQPNDDLYHELRPMLGRPNLQSLRLIGDAEAPNIIAQAVFAGHLAAREFDEAPVDGTPFRVERVAVSLER